MNDTDGHRIEAALQFGFEKISDDCPAYRCTETQLLAFAKACERKGQSRLWGSVKSRVRADVLEGVAEQFDKMNAEIDAELAAEVTL